MALRADLYLDRIDISKYLPQKKCSEGCGFSSCGEWLRYLKEEDAYQTQCEGLSTNLSYALEVVCSLDEVIPDIEITQHPVKGVLGLHGINGAGLESPVLITGNALATQNLLMALLATTTAPFHLLFVDCLGHTVDMAMVYKAFLPEKVCEALVEHDLALRVSHRELILPGATAPLKDALEAETGWNITIGPYCAGELPLFMGEMWSPPQGAA
jgi:CO dehydrogenase/acetyl-CoA synthase gamma subunit (corrinoid Fe-S protein)